jgi:hypothetical protein
MQTANDEPDLVQRGERSRIRWTLLVSFAVPIAAMALGSVQPALGLGVLVAGFAGAAGYGLVRRRVTREGTDERAWDIHRQAGAFAWMVTGVAIAATMTWMWVRYGIRAAEPYVILNTVWIVSYTSAALWRRWRGF